MADFDFGDLSSFSLGGSPSEGASFGGGYSFDTAGAPSFQDVAPLTGQLGVSGLDTSLPTQPEASGGAAGAVRGALQPFAEVAKAALPFAQIGAAGTNLGLGLQGAKTSAANAATARRGLKLQEQVAGQQQAAAAPLTEFGKKQLEASQAGQVPPAEEARIQNWLQGAIQHAQDYAARSGQGNSLMLTQWVNWLNKQAEEMRAAAIGEQQKLGITSLTGGASALGGAGQTAGGVQAGAQNQSAQIAALMEQANKALASLSAGAS